MKDLKSDFKQQLNEFRMKRSRSFISPGELQVPMNLSGGGRIPDEFKDSRGDQTDSKK
jgi:hypothetical protein